MLSYLLLAFVIILLQNDELFMDWLISNEVEKCRQDHIQIRDTTAFKSLNQVDVVCFDKTGVLTKRQMDVKNVYYGDSLPKGSDKARQSNFINIACALCNDVLFFEKLDQANAIDKALISFAEKNGIDMKSLLSQSKRIYEKPFDSENRYMVCGYKLKDSGVYYFAKGDPDIILKMCDTYLMESGQKKTADFDFLILNNENIRSINQRGNTSIALAYTSGSTSAPPSKFTFLCMLELENSLQYGVRDIIRQITDKGIRSVMLTGDRAETAVNIGKVCGITKNLEIYLIGSVIDRMALAEVARQSDYCSIFARLLPFQKGIMVRLFQQKHHYVAMIGDGPNDGIALKVADVGISFVKNSSPIARMLSKILINKLSDLLRLIEDANRIKRIAEFLKVIRILTLMAILIGLYLWIWPELSNCVCSYRYFIRFYSIHSF